MDNFYTKKITPYLDGSLSSEEQNEFEAFVRTHPEVEIEIKKKQEEMSLLKDLMPAPQLTSQSLESLNNELRVSIFNLLKPEPKNALDRIKHGLEDWFSR